MCRARRRANRLASVADSANCHRGRPKRRVSSSPTHAASSVGQHVGDPAPQLPFDGRDRGCRAVTRHRAGVAEAEVDVVMAVDAAEGCARRGLDERRERPGPLDHPGHGDAFEERTPGLLEQGGGAGMLRDEPLGLGGHQGGEVGAIDGTVGGHARSMDRRAPPRSGHPATRDGGVVRLLVGASVAEANVPADGARGGAGAGIDFEEARAAVGPAERAGLECGRRGRRGSAAAKPAHGGGASSDGRGSGTGQHGLCSWFLLARCDGGIGHRLRDLGCSLHDRSCGPERFCDVVRVRARERPSLRRSTGLTRLGSDR